MTVTAEVTGTVLRVGDRRDYGTGTLYQKNGVWWCRWRTRDGRRPHRRIGEARTAGKRAGLSRKEAEAKLREWVLADNSGQRADSRAPTVDQFGAVLIARLERDGRKRSHIETTQGHLRNHISPALGDLLLPDVTKDDIDRLVSISRSKQLSAKTIQNVLGTMSSLMTHARRDRWIDRNPVELADRPTVRRTTALRFLTLQELDRVLQTPLPDDDNQLVVGFPAPRDGQPNRWGGADAVRLWWPTVRFTVLLAAMSGMRLGELRELRWADVDYAAMKIRVRREFVRGRVDVTKSRRGERGIPIARRLLAELDEHHKRSIYNQDSDLVIPHPHTGGPLDRVRLLLHFHAALHRADVRQIRLHDLRHTFGTTCAASGQVSLRTLQEWMGHEDIRTTQIYADYMPGHNEAALIDEAFAPRTVRGPILANHGPFADQSLHYETAQKL